jgi:hypothetical protein
MNEYDQIRELLPERPAPSQQVSARAHSRLMAVVEARPATWRPIQGRRHFVLATIGATAVAAVAGVSLALGQSPGGGTATPASPTPTEVHLHLAAWSVDTSADKTITVTVRELSDPQKLTEILATTGVRSKVQFVQVPKGNPVGCYKHGEGLQRLPSDEVVSWKETGGATVVTIKPALMPSGSVLSFVIFGEPSGEPLTTYMTLFNGEPGPCELLPVGTSR